MGIIALYLGAFVVGTTEFIIQGLLPEIAGDLGVSIPSAGLLITAYATAAAIGGPLLVVAVRRLERKTALQLCFAFFIMGHVLAALAPTYTVLMVARVVTALCHGSFIGIGAVVAIQLAPPERRGFTLAIVGSAFGAANIVGVPAGTALGHAFGWRSTFWAVGSLGVLALAIMGTLPRVAAREGNATTLAAELRVLRRPRLLLTFAMAVSFASGSFALFTYIAPLLIEVTGISSSGIPGVLIAFGVGGMIGMIFGGRAADKKLMSTLLAIFFGLVVTSLLLTAVSTNKELAPAVLCLWAALFFASCAPITTRALTLSSEAPMLASAISSSATNVGILLGSFLGSLSLSSGVLGYRTLPLLSIVLFGGGLVAMFWSIALDHRERGDLHG